MNGKQSIDDIVDMGPALVLAAIEFFRRQPGPLAGICLADLTEYSRLQFARGVDGWDWAGGI
jgi:hypothetical protein